MSGGQFEETWTRLSQVVVKDAQYDSPKRRPHPKCLEGTREDLLRFIHGFLDDPEKSRLIWLHGTAGVGKSAIAFTVAEMMKSLKATEATGVEKRLGGTFFFSRDKTERRTTGYFFATLVYQLATNFSVIQNDVNRAIRGNPALLDPDTPLSDQMEALFLQPLRKLRRRLRECLPLTFVIDALDECTFEPELTDLILCLARALRESDIPVTHILLTSRTEFHISQAFQNNEVRSLVRSISLPVSGEGGIISLDSVDNDICTFLQHSFGELKGCYPDFPQPSEDDLAKLVSRAGRRFIMASTMMKFIIDDGHKDPHNRYKDPHGRLQLMLELTSELPGTDVYKLYDRILSTCTDPRRAYLHLSIVAALADPLPLPQISKLLGSGWDAETTLAQLRSVIDIPADTSLPVNIRHSSVRDYVSNPSNCSFLQVREYDIPSPHSLLAYSSLRLIRNEIPECTALLDALSELKKQSQAMQPDPQSLKDSLTFLIQPPEPLSVLICMLWLRGDRSSDLQSWLGTLDGCAWLQMQGGEDWLLKTQGEEWLQTRCGQEWLQTQGERAWLQIPGQQTSVQTRGTRPWLQTARGRDWLQTARGRVWLQGTYGKDWLQTQGGRNWLQTQGGQAWLQTQGGQDWLQTPGVQDWLQALAGREWLRAVCGKDWLQTQGGIQWLQTQGGQDWLQTQEGQDWFQTPGGQDWLQTPDIQAWLQTQGGRHWLQTTSGKDWLHTQGVRNWLQTQGGQDWLQTHGGRDWLQTPAGQAWLETPHGQAWESTPAASVWVTMEEFSRTVEAISELIIGPELPSLPAFKVIQQLKSLPDFLILPMFLALRSQSRSISASSPSLDDLSPPDRDVIHAMNTFMNFANEARERSRSASDALKYACQNWAMHISYAQNSWDDELNSLFRIILNRHLLPWFEMQWCLNGLRSCLAIITEGQKHIKAR